MLIITLADKIDDLVRTSGFRRIEQFRTLSVTGGEIRLGDTKSNGGGVQLFFYLFHSIQQQRSGFFRLSFFLLAGRGPSKRRRGLNWKSQQLLVELESESHVDLGVGTGSNNHNGWSINTGWRGRKRGRPPQRRRTTATSFSIWNQ